MTNSCAFRVQRDLKEILQAQGGGDGPPIFVTPVEDKLDHVVAVLLGPPATPYHFGFFSFDMRFPQTYPNDPPKCKITTTDFGRVRFNPNLYADGKVCLSILGTWRGESAEVWRSSYSIGYVLSAIQSLIMNSEPYHNEPGFEKETLERGDQDSDGDVEAVAAAAAAAQSAAAAAAAAPGAAAAAGAGGAAGAAPSASAVPAKKRRRDPKDVKAEALAYADKISHETLRVAVCDVLDSVISGRAEFFRAEIKREFLIRYETFVSTAEKLKGRDGETFVKTPFEYPSNIAEGKFDCGNLLTRLKKIRQQLDDETEQWRQKGRELTKRKSYVASTLKDEHARLQQEGMQGCSGGPVDDDNAFVWNLSVMQPEGLLEEGMFNIEIVFPENKEEFPRLRFRTPMFHPNISPTGYPCFPIPPAKMDSIDWLFQSVQKLLTSEPNPSEASWVNLEAAHLCFSSDPEKQKQWRRRCKQLARQSMEEPAF
eukprot:TRINITY_DN4668_c2_g1_i1.p1 TRINITY_DN4668_c2_g1~~TRINITY_DN4668_c2_g1_i1.p1  ORF type:complete len:482 (+),score=142.42 TRINITY_DN4668_c2_g1_i1:120-1565(+)